MAEKWSALGSVPERYRLGRVDCDRDQTDVAMYAAGLLAKLYPDADEMTETFPEKLEHFAVSIALTREIVNGSGKDRGLEVDQAEDYLAMVGIKAVLARRRERSEVQDA